MYKHQNENKELENVNQYLKVVCYFYPHKSNDQILKMVKMLQLTPSQLIDITINLTKTPTIIFDQLQIYYNLPLIKLKFSQSIPYGQSGHFSRNVSWNKFFFVNFNSVGV